MKEVRVNNLDISIDPISANDYILFEEKKIDPDSNIATEESVGYNDALIWLFNNFYFIDKVNNIRLSREFLDGKGFEVHHVMTLVNEIGRIKGTLEILDEADSQENSNHFKYNDFEIIRRSVPWSETKNFANYIQGKSKFTSTGKVNKTLIRKYFTINGETITEEYFSDPDLLPIDLFLLMTIRLGKLLSPS